MSECWLPIVYCPTDGVDRALLLPDGREVVGAHHNGGFGEAQGWVVSAPHVFDEAVYEEPLRGGFIASVSELAARPSTPPRKQIGTRKSLMWVVGPLPSGVYPSHFRPNDTVYGDAKQAAERAALSQQGGLG